MRTALLLVVLPGALAAQQPGLAPPPRESIVVGPAPRTTYDSTVRWLAEVGRQVAGVRSAAEQLRRAGYNFPDGVVRERLELMQGRCRQLAQVAREARTEICRSCVAANLRPVLERYRAQLTPVVSFATNCATRMRTLRTDGRPGASNRARQAARSFTSVVAQGLRAYEERVREVRVAFGWEPPPLQQRRGTRATPRP